MAKPRNRAEAMRRRAKKAQKKSYCPHPEKNPYLALDDALAGMLRRQRKVSYQLSVYECVCGYWHLTKQPGESRIREFDPFQYRHMAYEAS